ncbi:MAG: HD family phosphohydrolase [Oscillospiraceae bacterium]|nr:HD family phosphohydrolase [Oscillospiraceae bacterium]
MGKLYNAYISSYRMDTPQWGDFLKACGDIYNSPQLKSLEKYEQHFKINRLQHIRSVAYLSFLIARKLKLNYVETARAAVMHDLFYYDWRENDLSHKLHGYRHPGFALKNAYYLCGTLSERERDIIKKHMWPLTPALPRYPESFVVTMMDKYCAAIEMYYSFSEKYRDEFHKLTGIGGEK